MDLLTISVFARLSHLSPKALRLYDELRLLPPVHVDPDSGPVELTRCDACGSAGRRRPAIISGG